MKKILCLDFDGVICDSIMECLLISYNSFLEVEGYNKKPVQKVEELSPELIQRFYQYRYLVRPPEHYWLLISMILQNREITECSFNEELRNYKNQMNSFRYIFFQNRHQMMAQQNAYWLDLHKIYTQFKDFYHKYRPVIYIVTNKDMPSVKSILKSNGYKIKADYLFTNEKYSSKLSALNYIADLNNCTSENIYFVDDSPATIKEMAQHYSNSYLPSWGYYKMRDSDLKLIDSFFEIWS